MPLQILANEKGPEIGVRVVTLGRGHNKRSSPKSLRRTMSYNKEERLAILISSFNFFVTAAHRLHGVTLSNKRMLV